MSLDPEYAIRKDIQNHAVVRGIDGRQRREFRRLIVLGGLLVALLLLSAWQHFEMVRHGYAIERLRLERAAEDVINRQLRLSLETLRSPQQVERRARQLGLEPPSPDATLVIERAPAPGPPGAVVAHAR